MTMLLTSKRKVETKEKKKNKIPSASEEYFQTSSTQTDLIFNENKPKRVTFTDESFSSSESKRNDLKLEAKKKKQHEEATVFDHKEEKEEASINLQSVNLNEHCQSLVKNAILDKRSTRKLLTKARKEIKNFKFYNFNQYENDAKLKGNLEDGNRSKLKEIKYGKGRFGVKELTREEEKNLRKNDQSPPINENVEEGNIEHYVIERITSVNIGSRRMIFKKQKYLAIYRQEAELY
jgi:hypothetical protein